MSWKDLDPDVPLQGYEPEYVPRAMGGDHLAALLSHGLGPALLVGPPGTGRSTELNRARGSIGGSFRPMVIDVAHLFRGHGRAWYLHNLAEHLVDRVVDEDASYQPTAAIIEDLRASDPDFSRGRGKVRDPLSLIREVLSELGAHLEPRRLALLVDGLDGWSPETGVALLRALAEIAPLVTLGAVACPHLVTGPAAQDLLAVFRTVELPIPASEEGEAFLTELLARRRTHDEPLADEVLVEAMALSGGFPRIFLKLIRDAAVYAGVLGLPEATLETLERATLDQLKSLKMQLESGDLDALAEADGTEALSLPAARRGRLLTQGLLIPHVEGGRALHAIAPLAARLMGPAAARSSP